VTAPDDATLPRYDELPVRPDLPPRSSWSVWGDDDELGTLNLLTEPRTLRALQHVRQGRVFNLGLPLHEPRRNAQSRRSNPVHQILYVGHEKNGFRPGVPDDLSTGSVGRDDYLELLWLQGSTQWDGLGHFRHLEHGNYNGVPDADIHGEDGARLGVDRWAARGIVGRGVLADVARYRQAAGRPLDPTGHESITADDLAATLEHQGTTVEAGDVLVLRTGWMGHFLDQDDAGREHLMIPANQSNPGLEGSDAMLTLLWDLHVAALAADNITVEAHPTDDPELAFRLHSHLLPLIGMPLGELWVLDDLAKACAADGDHAFLLVSVPLNVRGGLGSPAQAVAIR
jgi:kynurenine formamidase